MKEKIIESVALVICFIIFVVTLYFMNDYYGDTEKLRILQNETAIEREEHKLEISNLKEELENQYNQCQEEKITIIAQMDAKQEALEQSFKEYQRAIEKNQTVEIRNGNQILGDYNIQTGMVRLWTAGTNFETLQETMEHELWHVYYFQYMNLEEHSYWTQRFRNAADFPTEHSKENVWEYHAAIMTGGLE